MLPTSALTLGTPESCAAVGLFAPGATHPSASPPEEPRPTSSVGLSVAMTRRLASASPQFLQWQFALELLNHYYARETVNRHLLVNWMRQSRTAFVLLIALVTLAAVAQQSPAKPPAASQTEPLTIADLAVQQILEPLRTGIITRNVNKVLSVFDKDELTNGADLEGHLQAFFQHFQEINFRYQLMQVTQDKERASAIVEMDMDTYPYETTGVAVRRSTQMRIQLTLTPKGWRIASFTPSDFFNVEYNGTPGP
jgi:hypothetical protein